jgi:hypothetical protein
MILHDAHLTSDELERRTGWVLKPEGVCKGDRCVPLPGADPNQLEAHVLAERLQMAFVHDDQHDLWSLGPEYDTPLFTQARAPELTLPDKHGNPFSLSSLRGQKVLLVAWASW